MKFTKDEIERLKPKASGKYYVRADMGSTQKHGLALCIYPTGKKSWFFIYTFDGRRNSLCLGHYPEMDTKAAHKKFDEQWDIFSSGKNPATVQHDKHIERRESPTLKDLGQDYVEQYAKVHKRSWKQDERTLDVEVYPVWGSRKAQDISKGDVLALLQKVVDRGSPHTADVIYKILRKMFKWAYSNDKIPISPCVTIERKATPSAKNRTLKLAEIKKLWNALDAPTTEKVSAAMTLGVKNAIKLILITAQRPIEVSGMHTDEIEDNWWTIPAERSKNKKAHRVPLTPLALNIIKQTIQSIKQARKIPEDKEYSGYIFPTPHRSREEPIDRHALSKALKRDTVEGLLFGLKPFTPHDLRRTTATMLAEMQEMDEVIDAILNHSKQGVIKVYNQYRYDNEKQKALATFSDKITAAVAAPRKRLPIYKLTDNRKFRIIYNDQGEEVGTEPA